jgi:hypothetical protein
MKVHDEIESLTDVYLAGGLDENERRDVESHAQTCATCAAILRDATEFQGWLKGTSASGAPPAGLEDRVIANFRARTLRRSPKLIRLLAGVAALFAFVVIGGLFSKSDEGTQIANSLAPGKKAGVGYTGGADGAAGEWAPVEQERGPKFREGESKERSDAFYSSGVGGGAGGGERLRNTPRKDARPASAAATPPPPGEAMDDADLKDHNESEDLEKNLDKKADGKPGAGLPYIDDRKIIRNADLHLEVEKYDEAYGKIGAIVREKKGFIAGASTTRLANNKIRATVTLRIPPDQFETALAELGKLGTVRHQSISTADVTKQYQDLESRLKSKETLVERLKKVLLEGKGTVKELMEVEVQMGATIEQIESIKGELKYYDNLVGLSTITMQVFEKDLGLPFEYVQTLQSVITVRSMQTDAAYAAAQKAIVDAGGQVVDSRMTRSNDESATGFVRGKVDSDKFPGVREALRKLGDHIDQDTVNQQQTGRGGQGNPNPDAKVRKEQAVIDFTVNTPPVFVARRASLTIESSSAKSAYESARQEIAAANGKILGGSLNDRNSGVSASVMAQADDAKFAALLEKLKSLGTVKTSHVKQEEPGSEPDKAFQMRGEISLQIVSPPALMPEESGIGKVLRETFTRSVAGVLWSFEKLIVGIALAGPWIVLAGVVFLVWRRVRRKSKPTAA